MKKFAVISDSACDLTVDLVKRHGIDIVPFTVSFDKINKLTEGVDITNDEFYRRLEVSDIVPKTYFPTVSDFVEKFKIRLEQGQDILCLCLSSKLSKSYISAVNAKKILSKTYPNNKIMVIDTLQASAGQSLLVLDAVKLSGGVGVEEAYKKLEEAKKDAYSIVTVASLEQLARGGRMSNTTAVFGKLLKINPIIYLEEGALVSKEKALGRKKALELLKALCIKETGGQLGNYDFGMMHSRAAQEANTIANELSSSHGIKLALPPLELGITIGTHTGASVVAVAFVKKIS